MTVPVDLSRKSPKRRNGNAEARIQAGIVAWIRTVAPDALVFAIPNGGLRSKSEAARLKWCGVAAGIPDLCLIVPGGRVHFIEVKAPGGYTSPEQTQMLIRLVRLGVECLVARSIDDVRIAFKQWRIETREVAS